MPSSATPSRRPRNLNPGVERRAVPPAEEARQALGQRRVNLIWESTQAVIAVAVTAVTLAVAGYLSIGGASQSAALTLLQSAFFLIVGFYFGRTNHEKVGGVNMRR